MRPACGTPGHPVAPRCARRWASAAGRSTASGAVSGAPPSGWAQPGRLTTGHRGGIAPDFGVPAPSASPAASGGSPKYHLAPAKPLQRVSAAVFSPRRRPRGRIRQIRAVSATSAPPLGAVLEPLAAPRTAAPVVQPRAIPRRAAGRRWHQASRSASLSSPSCRAASASCSARRQRATWLRITRTLPARHQGRPTRVGRWSSRTLAVPR